MQAVILAGGKGTRLADRLAGRPKPLVEVGGVPLLARQIEALKASGIDSVVLLVNHAADQIAKFCADHANFGIDVALIDDGKPLGTAGALLNASDHLQDRFVVVYGDTLFDIDITRLVAAHEAASADGTLFLHPNDHPHDSDLVDLDEHGFLQAFHPYPHPAGAYLPNLVNAAFYVLEKSALVKWRNFDAPADLAKDLFPAMVKAGARLLGYRSFEYIKDLGTPERLEKVEQHLAGGRPARSRADAQQACVFLDRDGTLNVLAGFVTDPKDLQLYPHAGEAVRRLNEAEFRVALVTNQPVIARGDCTVEQLESIHRKLETELGREGAFLDGIWWCPHHPDSGFAGEIPALKIGCSCRKPELGLILSAKNALNADLSRSWLIGDTTSDILAAKRAGVASILVRTGEGGRDKNYGVWADFVVKDVSAAVDLIVKDFDRWSEYLERANDGTQAGELIVVDGPFAHIAAATCERVLRRRGLRAHWIPDTLIPFTASGGPRSLLGVIEPWLTGGFAQFSLKPGRSSRPAETYDFPADAVVILACEQLHAREIPTARNVRHVDSRELPVKEATDASRAAETIKASWRPSATPSGVMNDR